MSNLVNDQIMDNIVSDVADLSDVQVMMNLNDANVSKVSKFTGNKFYGADINAYARDVLAQQMFDDLGD